MAKAVGEVVDLCHGVEGGFLGLGSCDAGVEGGGIRAGTGFLGSLCCKGGRGCFNDCGPYGWGYLL